MLMKAGQVSAITVKHFCGQNSIVILVLLFPNQELRWRLITQRNSTLVMMKRTKGLKKKEITGECLTLCTLSV